ncbi:20031_t:CDS:2 [Entrophospora sp. SA101]|nr:20031_t:CDS:2 [Entrophospora sp. SA101]
MDNSFDFNQFLIPLAKSKINFNLPETKKEDLFYIVNLEPFGILKAPKQKTDLKKELQEKLNYFQAEHERAQNLLNNENFLKKVPANLVEKEKKKLSEPKKDMKNKIMLKQLFLNWEESVPRLQSRGETVAQLVINLKKKLHIQEQELVSVEQELQQLLERIPNLPAEDTPLKENKIIDETKYKQEIKPNLTYEKIARQLEIIDEKASVKLSGSRFAVYRGLGAQLVHALINLMLSEQRKKGYQIFTIPYLVQSQNLYHAGQLPKLKEDMFKIENSDFYLIPTAEVPLVNLYQNEILGEKDLPLKLCAYSPCFRAEAGAAGQENKGLIRLHQFHKVELVQIAQPENSYQRLKEIVEDARNILHLLKIPHRVIELCVEELGFSAAKTYDLERAKIRVKKENGQKYYPHSLNGSGLAIDRLIVVLLEYYYNQDKNVLEVKIKLIKAKIPVAQKKYLVPELIPPRGEPTEEKSQQSPPYTEQFILAKNALRLLLKCCSEGYNISEIIREAEKAGVKHILNTGQDMPTNRLLLTQLKNFPNLFGALGLHPNKTQLTNKKIIAIGEIGLDYYRTFTDIAKQKTWFEKQLELAKKYNLPVLLHIRSHSTFEAFADAYEIVKKAGIKKGVLHCFTGNWEIAEKEVLEKAPLEKIVIETDAPYLIPEPLRGRQTNNYPQNIIYTLKKIAEIKKMAEGEVAKIIYLNTLRFFGLLIASPNE